MENSIIFDNFYTSSIPQDFAPYMFFWLLCWFLYYFLKIKNVKFINDNEVIIIALLFFVLPILIMIIYFIFKV